MQHEARTLVVEHARTYRVPEPTAADLFAHVLTLVGHPIDARRVCAVVMDLGWRPVVGRTPAQLWTQEDR